MKDIYLQLSKAFLVSVTVKKNKSKSSIGAGSKSSIQTSDPKLEQLPEQLWHAVFHDITLKMIRFRKKLGREDDGEFPHQTRQISWRLLWDFTSASRSIFFSHVSKIPWRSQLEGHLAVKMWREALWSVHRANHREINDLLHGCVPFLAETLLTSDVHFLMFDQSKKAARGS